MALYFLWGDEDYLIESALNKIKNDVLKDNINPLNYRRFDNPNYADFCQILRSTPMMFGDMLFVIKCQSYLLETKSKIKLEDNQIQELVSALNSINEGVHIVLLCPTPFGEKKKPDSRKKLYKEITKIVKPQSFESFKSYEEYKIAPYVNKMATKLNLKISNDNISFLIQTTGPSLRNISNSLEKLKLMAHPENNISKDMIEEISTSSGDIYTLCDLILEKKHSKALNFISQMLQKEHFLPSLMFLQATISNLLKTKIYSSTMSSYEIASKIGMSEFLVKKNIQRISTIPVDEIVRLKLNLENLEYDLKSGNIKDVILGYEKAFGEQ